MVNIPFACHRIMVSIGFGLIFFLLDTSRLFECDITFYVFKFWLGFKARNVSPSMYLKWVQVLTPEFVNMNLNFLSNFCIKKKTKSSLTCFLV